MYLVPEEVGTAISAVAVVDPEEGAFGPEFVQFLGVRFYHVQDYGQTVLVVVPDQALRGSEAGNRGGYEGIRGD